MSRSFICVPIMEHWKEKRYRIITLGFPSLNPDLDSFERLLLDIYKDLLTKWDDSEKDNAKFQMHLIRRIRCGLSEVS